VLFLLGQHIADTSVVTMSAVQIPTQREPAPSSYEQGHGTGDVVHAARKTLRGPAALCDGTAVTSLLAGRFDPVTAGACPACAGLLTASR
jgi:hypothetical protein